MTTKPKTIALLASLLLSACSSSPDNHSVWYSANNIVMNDETAHRQMKSYLAGAESQLLALEQQETKQCMKGQLTIAQTFLTQATGEHNAHMDKDAFITLLEFDRQVRKIRCINQYIAGNLGCSYSQKKQVLKDWYREGDFQQCKSNSKAQPAISSKDIVVTETLHDFDHDKIKPIYWPSLNSLVNLMQTYPLSRLQITGHADSQGSGQYNLALSKRRAQQVAKYFTDKGIASSQISIIAKGEQALREVERDNVARVFNRYTAITLFLVTDQPKAI